MNYKVSYGCTTKDDIIHVAEFKIEVDGCSEFTSVINHILKEIDGDIKTLNISFTETKGNKDLNKINIKNDE